jgi:hypothetical protein
MSKRNRSTVLLSDTDEAQVLARYLEGQSLPAACYPSVSELLRDRGLSSISVLVLVFRPLPAGVILATLGRINLEYPRMQKVVVLDQPPPLPIAQYLTSCSVNLIRFAQGDEKGVNRLAAVVHHLQDRADWLMPWSQGESERPPAALEVS